MHNKKLGAVDVGTNSIRMLIGEVQDNKSFKVLETARNSTRIGQGMSEQPLLRTDAMERTIAGLKEFKLYLNDNKVDELRIVATSAVRDSKNKQKFIQLVKGETGLDLEVLTGEEEAELTYLGAINSLPVQSNSVVIDIGGGSTEYIWQGASGIQLCSINAGAVRLFEKPLSKVELKTTLNSALEKIKPNTPVSLIGVGGTVTTAALVELKMKEYNPLKTHGFKLTYSSVRSMWQELVEKEIKERRKIVGLPSDRADIIPFGLEILLISMEELNANEIIVSEEGIMHGIIARLIHELN
ncbi:exopolyphosphatase/guanosine-5'-triphosphate,3'-diphosphate pyrophosphatase [Desulfitispora alkaliphila]|uniref:Ppx/GppA phosphatase family protein n=1 Tax=Desulfitispora alkaliphila TaxID=622674 RepID=UPI003D1A49DF